MAKKIQVTIAEPCHENWEQMNPVEKGRFCGSCQKQVVDFSNMSDREIAVFFKKPSTGSVCGRFMQDQLDREMEIPKKRIPWIKYFFQLALPAFMASSKATAQGMVKMGKPAIRTTTPIQPVRMVKGDAVIMPETATRSVCNMSFPNQVTQPVRGITIAPLKFDPTQFMKQTVPTTVQNSKVYVWGGLGIEPINNKTAKQVKGKVINEFGDPVAYANIMIDGGKRVQADSNGIFTITPSRKWKKMDLYVTAAGFIEQSREVIRKEQGSDELIINLAARSILPEVIINSHPNYYCVKTRTDVVESVSKSGVLGCKTSGITITTYSNDNDPIKNDNPTMLKVYPNPVISGSTINIGCKDIEEGYYTFQLLSLSGQVVRHRELWVDDKAVVLNMEVPKVAAGIYLLRMVNKKSGKSLTEKIVIQ